MLDENNDRWLDLLASEDTSKMCSWKKMGATMEVWRWVLAERLDLVCS
jgi:hypothetical protein